MRSLLTLIVILISFVISSAGEIKINRQPVSPNDIVYGRSGTVTYPDAHCHIYVPDDFVFLNKSQTRHLLVDCWGNADDSRYFGALVSSQYRTFGDIDCAYFVSYEPCGYIPKDTLRHFNYNALLAQDRASLARRQSGMPPDKRLLLAGWGWKPRFDGYIQYLPRKYRDADGEVFLNLDMLVVGRKGYVSAMAVAPYELSDSVRQHKLFVANSIHFTREYNHHNFNPYTDSVATWVQPGREIESPQPGVRTKRLQVNLWPVFLALIFKFVLPFLVLVVTLAIVFRKDLARSFSRQSRDEDSQSQL